MLQVAVDDVSVMEINDGAQDLPHDVACLLLRVGGAGSIGLRQSIAPLQLPFDFSINMSHIPL